MYSAEAPAYPYDPARARALLAEAGWTPGADGICRNAAGERLSLEFSTTAGVRVRELVQQVMQSEWRRIGVETTISNEPARTLFGETLKHRGFKGLAMFAWISAIESTPRQTLQQRADPDGGQQLGRRQLPRLPRRRRWMPTSTRWRRNSIRRSGVRCGPRCSASTPSSCRCCRCSSAPRRMSGRNG